MRAFLSFLLGALSAAEAFVIWPVLFLGFDFSFLASAGIAVGAGIVTFLGLKGIADYKYLKKLGLSRKEYAYIQKNLREAKLKMAKLQKSFFSVRNLGAFKQMYELNRLVKRMYAIVHKEPRRFYQSERFFFYHLDSISELAEKYAYLAAQPVKNEKMYLSLKETKSTLEDLSESVKKDIYEVLSKDVDDLAFELDVAKHSLKKLEYEPFEEERGTKHE